MSYKLIVDDLAQPYAPNQRGWKLKKFHPRQLQRPSTPAIKSCLPWQHWTAFETCDTSCRWQKWRLTQISCTCAKQKLD